MMACGGGVELDACLSWLALTMTPVSRHGCCRDCANLVRRTRFFKTPLRRLEACNLTAPMAQAIYNQQTFCRAEKEVDTIRRFGCKSVNCNEPEYPRNLLQICDPPNSGYA